MEGKAKSGVDHRRPVDLGSAFVPLRVVHQIHMGSFPTAEEAGLYIVNERNSSVVYLRRI